MPEKKAAKKAAKKAPKKKKAAPKKKAAKKAPVKKRAPQRKKTKAREVSRVVVHAVSNFERQDPHELMHYINMEFGSSGPVVRPAASSWNAFDLRRPSGISSLDVAMGGGLPAGGLSQLDGPESTGKNFALYLHMAECQRIYGKASCMAMVSLETAMDKHFAQKCGVLVAMSPYDIGVENRARKRRGQPPMSDSEIREAMDMPTVGEFMILDQGPAEKILDGMVEVIKSNACQIVGVDSWDSILTYQERDTPLGEFAQQASNATLETKFTKKMDDALAAIFRCPECGAAPLGQKKVSESGRSYNWHCPSCRWKGLDPAVEVNETTIIAIRQVRGKRSAPGQKVFGRPYESKGSHALRHANLIKLSLHPGQRIPKDTKKEKLGKEVNWEVEKGKCGCHEGARGTFSMYFDTMSVDVYTDLVRTCMRYGVIEQGGGYYKIPHLDMRLLGKEKLLQRVEESPELWDGLRDQLYIEADLAKVRFR